MTRVAENPFKGTALKDLALLIYDLNLFFFF
jgi:hypothetical protein